MIIWKQLACKEICKVTGEEGIVLPTKYYPPSIAALNQRAVKRKHARRNARNNEAESEVFLGGNNDAIFYAGRERDFQTSIAAQFLEL